MFRCMKITQSIDSCLGGKCPALHLTDDGRVVVQGYRLNRDEQSAVTTPDGESSVVMDLEVFRRLASDLKV